MSPSRKYRFHHISRVSINNLLFVMMLCVISNSYAVTPDQSGWQFKAGNKITENSNFQQRYPGDFQDDITSDQKGDNLKLTPTQQHQRLVWGLSQHEEKRYVLLMKNKSGVYYKNTKLNPVEILGINARTDSERDYYASLAADYAFRQNAKLLAFNNAYHQAAVTLKNRLRLPMVRSFDVTPYSPYHYKPLKLEAKDQLSFFVKVNDPVRAIMSVLIRSLQKHTSVQLNIYFLSNSKAQSVNKDTITQWAKSQNIPAEMTKNKKITLNVGASQYATFLGRNKKLKTPLLFLIRHGKSKMIDLGRF